MAQSAGKPISYYQQTTSAYLEALSRAHIDAAMDVLEIGSDRTHHKLRIIKDLCASAYALDIFFHVPQDQESATFVHRLLADMCTLPFVNESLDLVIVSASLHHAPDLEQALREIYRVLRVGARAIVVNEPVEGTFKRFGSALRHTRNELIHEDPISWREWRSAVTLAGLRADQFLPAWFGQHVVETKRLPYGTRFRFLAKAIRPLLSRPTIADAARLVGRRPGQSLLGLPLNAVLWKD
jgi:SAM-dependent methyltransferase